MEDRRPKTGDGRNGIMERRNDGRMEDRRLKTEDRRPETGDRRREKWKNGMVDARCSMFDARYSILACWSR
jgi:hypothetical protein